MAAQRDSEIRKAGFDTHPLELHQPLVNLTLLAPRPRPTPGDQSSLDKSAHEYII